MLLDGVSDVQIYFYRGNGWTNAQSSGDLTATACPAPRAAQRELPVRRAPGADAAASSG